MPHIASRRAFLKAAGTFSAGACLAGGYAVPAWADATAKGSPHAEKLGWRLGCQAYTFNHYTFLEAAQKTGSLGLHYLEAYPGQRLGFGEGDAMFGEGMSPAIRSEVKKRLGDLGLHLVNYGVVGLSKDEPASRRVFDFARDMGIETIVSEPAPDAFDLLDKLCGEYQINVALHNHPDPSRYWNPDTVLDATKDHSPRIGACADTGHWMRSGINPVDAIRKLRGRIISFHFKDLNSFGHKAHDVPWGTGKADVRRVLAEIHRQGLKAVFSIEYETNWTTSLPEIAQSVAYFDQVADELATKPAG